MLILSLILLLVGADPIPPGGAKCNSSADCNIRHGGGVCHQQNISEPTVFRCKCSPAYGNMDCSYTRLNRNQAIMLQVGPIVIMIYGLGNLYLGHIALAICQLGVGIVAWVNIVALCIICRKHVIYNQSATRFLVALLIIMILCGSIWSIYDGRAINKSSYTDSNGYWLY